jgi:hypothetical protein
VGERLYHFSKLERDIVKTLIPQPLLPSWEKGSKKKRSLSRILKNGIRGSLNNYNGFH